MIVFKENQPIFKEDRVKSFSKHTMHFVQRKERTTALDTE